MKDRLSKISKRATHALCLLAACGLTYSCADEYKLDDEAPTWLGSSIYDYLEEKGNYTNFVRLINDLNLKDVLSTTGSRTLFVANDSAFQRFYDQNAADAAVNPNTPWGNATSYDKLSKAQKKLLLNSAMLNNAYLMEMMSRSEGTVTKGANMRKVTSVELTDSIPVLRADEFPVTKNPDDKNYWTKYKNKGKFYVVSDNSTPMMVFFADDFLSKSSITSDDFKFIVGQERGNNEYFIYNNKVINKDITCQNGYIHELENVLIPQPNMAEVIRNNGETNIFSHILDRFSAPYYDANLTKQYHDNIDQTFVDSIFVRKYYSQITNTSSVTDYMDGNTLSKGPDGEVPTTAALGILKLDPAWNQFTANNGTAEDMAAMFVPNDKAMYEYFTSGEGRDIYDNYALDNNHGSLNNLEPFYNNLDQIPLSILNSLVSNLMQKSFVESVPSKFTTILDQANDNLFTDAEETKQNIEEVKIANNGVIYIMKKVYPPVDYAAVVSPAYIGDNYKVMKFAIYNGEGSDGKKNLMNLNYYAYLRAKGDGIKFSLFLPSDEAMQNYIDPLSIAPDANVKPRILSYTYNSNKSTDASVAPLNCEAYSYDIATGQKGKQPIIGTQPKQAEYLNRLADILETHTIVHDVNQDPAGIRSGNEYYLSKSGSPVRVRFDGDKVLAQGGMQIDNEISYPDQSGSVAGFYNSTTDEIYEKTNGTTYCINAPIQPAVKSVYTVMHEMGNQKFFDLCNGATEEILTKTGIVVYSSDIADDEEKQQKELNKYLIFARNGGLDMNVTFFTKFNYTIYVPTDAAIEKEINEKKLPTWESIEAYIKQYENDPKWETEYKEKAAAQVSLLLNFIRGHFQDNTEFADQVATGKHTYNSATLDEAGQKFITITSYQQGNGEMILKKDGYYDCKVTSKKNKIARDYITNVDYTAEDVVLSSAGTGQEGSKITSSSYSVLHEIDGVLRNANLNGKTYEDLWKTTAAAKQTVAHFHIKNK